MKPYWPVDMQYPIFQRFGEHPENYTQRNGHPGIDFGTPKRSPWYATWDGPILAAAYRKAGGYGREIFQKVLDRWVVVYGHADELLVSVGENVKRGQLIGYSGGGLDDPYRGNSKGEHTHLEVRDLTKPQILPLIGAVDPEIWLATDLDGAVEPVAPDPVMSDTVSVVSDWVSVRLNPNTTGDPIGKLLYGMKLTKAGDALPGTGNVKAWQPVVVYVATGWNNEDYLE